MAFAHFKKGQYDSGQGELAGFDYTELSGLPDKTHDLSFTHPTLLIADRARRLCHNPSDPLAQRTLLERLEAIRHPDQQYVYCHLASKGLRKQLCKFGYDNVLTDPGCRIGKNTLGKVRTFLLCGDVTDNNYCTVP